MVDASAALAAGARRLYLGRAGAAGRRRPDAAERAGAGNRLAYRLECLVCPGRAGEPDPVGGAYLVWRPPHPGLAGIRQDD